MVEIFILIFISLFVHIINDIIFIGSPFQVKLIGSLTKNIDIKDFVIIQSPGDVYSIGKYFIFFNPNINISYCKKKEMLIHEISHVYCKKCVHHDNLFKDTYKNLMNKYH